MTIKITNLNCSRGDQLILQNVSFELATGNALILRGPNGCGKTTLLRHLAGLSNDVSENQPIDPNQIVFGGHLDAIKTALTVQENLEFWAGIYDFANPLQIADKFGLTPLLDRPASNMSAGQKRRLGLTRFQISSAPIWLMDEPTVSLDAATTQMLLGEIDQHCAAGGIAIISTHIDLPLKSTTILNLEQFKPTQSDNDPFLDGEY